LKKEEIQKPLQQAKHAVTTKQDNLKF
jgi:hypothetical protein